MLIVGFEGREPPTSRHRFVAGYVTFTRNYGSLDEIAEQNRALAALARADEPPVILSLDQEGGRVQRIRAPLTVWPPMATVGAGSQGDAEAAGHKLGTEIAALGFNVDYAPVLDVHSNPANPIIGDRAFSSDPSHAGTMALAFWRGLESAGVRGCGKHFPGHGDTATDSHLELPVVDKSLDQLRACELVPFAAAAKAGVPLYMTAHVVYPQVDPLPATMSRRWLTDILRGELAYRGVIVSDDLDMKAVADGYPLEQVLLDGLRAGVDVFLACRDVAVQQKSLEILERAYRDDATLRARMDDAIARVDAFRKTLTPPRATPWRQTVS